MEKMFQICLRIPGKDDKGSTRKYVLTDDVTWCDERAWLYNNIL